MIDLTYLCDDMSMSMPFKDLWQTPASRIRRNVAHSLLVSVTRSDVRQWDSDAN